MLRLISTVVGSSKPLTRWAPLGLQANAKLPVTLTRPPTRPVRLFASFIGNDDNVRYSRLEPRIERKLGEYEDFFFETGRDKGWAQIMMLVSVQSEKELSSENISRAFANLQRRHAALRMAVILKDGKNHFAEVPDAPDLEILQTSDSKAIMASEEQTGFDFGQLLWRCKILQPEKSEQGFLYPFIFVIQACLTDGTAIHSGLYPSLQDYLEASFEQKEDLDIESLPLLPPREHLLDQFESILDQEGAGQGQHTQIENEINQAALAAKFCELHKPSNPQNCSGVVDFVFDQKQVSQLERAVAQQNVSMNSACAAAHAMAVYMFLTDLGADLGTMSLPSQYVVELRRYATPRFHATHSGAYVALAINNIKLNAEMVASENRSGVLWKLAASIKKETRERLAENEPLLEVKAFLGDYKRFQSDRNAYYRECDPCPELFYTSNLGHIPVNCGQGKVTIKKIQLLKGAREPAAFGHNITSLNGQLQWEISYNKTIVSDELAETYLSLVKGEFERFLIEQ
ncbi:uncharacterized protein LOC135484944 [Lineus longissimus]|uniref:uncharacterized protein LOC135484944 n=1 Tax=Lineus longissimus TaxID=88925 RepID=UPI002B4C4510